MAAVWFVLLTHQKYKQKPVSLVKADPKCLKIANHAVVETPKTSSKHGGSIPGDTFGVSKQNLKTANVLRSSRKIRDIQEQQITGPDRLPVCQWM